MLVYRTGLLLSIYLVHVGRLNLCRANTFTEANEVFTKVSVLEKIITEAKRKERKEKRKEEKEERKR